MSKPSEQSFEQALAELEKIVKKMESGELTLEQALATHKRGLELAKFCQQRLESAQQQVKVLEGEVLKPLDKLGGSERRELPGLDGRSPGPHGERALPSPSSRACRARAIARSDALRRAWRRQARASASRLCRGRSDGGAARAPRNRGGCRRDDPCLLARAR